MRLKHVVLTAAAAALAPALLLATPALAADSAATPSAVAVVTASATDDYPVDEMSDDDVRVAIARIIGAPDSGKAVKAAAQRALNGTIGDQRTFLKSGLRLARAEDDRVAIARILADPTISDALRAAAGAALDENTPEALRYFLEVGQYEV